MSLKMRAAVGTVNGCLDIPPYVTIVEFSPIVLISSNAFLPPTQLRASDGAGISFDLNTSVDLEIK